MLEDPRPWWRRPVRGVVVGVLYVPLAVGAAGVMPYAYIADLAGTALAFALGREPHEWKARHLRIALWVIGLVASLIAHPEGFRILDAELRLPETLFRARVYAVGFPILEAIFVMLRSTASRHEDVLERDR